MENILGISLGTRLMGVAVLYDGELSNFRVRTFYGAWTNEKRKNMIETIQGKIERYGITVIVVKTPKPAHCSKSIQDLVIDLQRLSEQLNIKLTVCTISCLKKKFGDNPQNKQILIHSIIRKYPNHPQLVKLYRKERNNRSEYHVKLFEAIACTELV